MSIWSTKGAFLATLTDVCLIALVEHGVTSHGRGNVLFQQNMLAVYLQPVLLNPSGPNAIVSTLHQENIRIIMFIFNVMFVAGLQPDTSHRTFCGDRVYKYKTADEVCSTQQHHLRSVGKTWYLAPDMEDFL